MTTDDKPDPFAPPAISGSRPTDPFELFRQRLEDHGCHPQRKSNGGLLTRCSNPAHDDHNPSLSVDRGDDGRVLLCCHRDCTVEEICSPLGLTLADLFPRNGNGNSLRSTTAKDVEPPPAEEEVSAAHAALCEDPDTLASLIIQRKWSLATIMRMQLGLAHDGSIVIPFRAIGGELLTVERYVPPWIRGNGSKMVAASGRERELLLPPGGILSTVFIVEGLNDAIAASSAGVPAIGVPSAMWSERFTETLRVADVHCAYAIGDCDAPGRTFAQKAAESLRRAGIDARAIDLDPSRSDGYDVTDLLLEHDHKRGREILEQLASEAESPLDALATETAVLLDDICAFIRSYVAMSDWQAAAVALWTAHTYAFESAGATAYLHVKSAEPSSGKTRLAEVASVLVKWPWYTGRTTAAALVRKIERDRPTLILDETDAAFRGAQDFSEALRGVLNSGYRPGGKATLCVTKGREIDIADFSVYCPKMLVGLGALPDTVASRSIPITLKRRAPNERVERFTYGTADALAAPLRDRLDSWAELAIEKLETIDVDDLIELPDRAAEVWRPLLAIAGLASPEWEARTRRAALTLSGGAASIDRASSGIQLLAAIRRLFDDGDHERVSTDALLKEINADEELPWGGFGRGDGLNARALADMLRPFEVRPKTIRMGGETPRGYVRADFQDAWTRNLPPSPEKPQQVQHPQHATDPQHENAREYSDVADVADVAGRPVETQQEMQHGI